MLDREVAGFIGEIEMIALDDGGGDEALASAVAATTRSLRAPAQFVLGKNVGRAKARNRLAARSRGRHLLFLDCDMMPDSLDFLATYLRLIELEDPAVVCGGISVLQTPERPEHALHRHWTQRLECLPAAARRAAPERYVFTTNILIRRDILAAEPFDEQFRGWGWEDAEWGVRVARRWPISHIDNSTTHLGLNTPRTLMARARESSTNFGKFAAAHPETVARYPVYCAARLLRHAPFRSVIRVALSAIVSSPLAPAATRAFALRLYRATLYADVV